MISPSRIFFEICPFRFQKRNNGGGGVPKICFSLESSSFCYLGAHAKFQNPSCLLSGRKATSSERKKERARERKRNSASADGGPRSRVRARRTLRSAPYPRERIFSGARSCRIQNSATSLSRIYLKLGHFPVKIGLIRGVGGVPDFIF